MDLAGSGCPGSRSCSAENPAHSEERVDAVCDCVCDGSWMLRELHPALELRAGSAGKGPGTGTGTGRIPNAVLDVPTKGWALSLSREGSLELSPRDFPAPGKCERQGWRKALIDGEGAELWGAVGALTPSEHSEPSVPGNSCWERWLSPWSGAGITCRLRMEKAVAKERGKSPSPGDGARTWHVPGTSLKTLQNSKRMKFQHSRRVSGLSAFPSSRGLCWALWVRECFPGEFQQRSPQIAASSSFLLRGLAPIC